MTGIVLQHPPKYRSKIFRFVKAIEEQVFLISRGILYGFFQALNIILVITNYSLFECCTDRDI